MSSPLGCSLLSPHATPFVPASRGAAGPASPKTRPLDRAQEERQRQFFEKGRLYTYYAEIDPESIPGSPRKEPLVISYEFSLISLLKELKEAIGRVVPVEGIFLQGGAALEIIKGPSGRPPADLDLVIEIEPGAEDVDWAEIEAQFLQTLENQTGIESRDLATEDRNIFLREYLLNGELIGSERVGKEIPNFLFSGAKGARLSRILVRNDEDEFAVHSLPTSFQSKSQPIDLQIVFRSKNNCYTSVNSVRVQLDDLLSSREKGTVLLRAVDGYDLDEALELISEGSFTVDPGRIPSIHQGLLGYCRTVCRGYYPQDWSVEVPFWQTWIQQMTSKREENFGKYLDKHYKRDLLGKAVFLLNLGEIAIRSRPIGEKESPEETRVRMMIFKALCAALGSDFHSEKNVDVFLHQAASYLSCFQATKELRGPNKPILQFIPVAKKGEKETHYLLARRPEITAEVRAHSYDMISNDLLMTRLIALLGHDDSDMRAILLKKGPTPVIPPEPIDLWVRKVKEGKRGIDCSPHFLCSKDVLTHFRPVELRFLTDEMIRTIEQHALEASFPQAILLLKIAVESPMIVRLIDPDRFNQLFVRIFTEQRYNQSAIPIYRAYANMMGPVPQSFYTMAQLVSEGCLPPDPVFKLVGALKRPEDFGVYQDILARFLIDHPPYETEILRHIPDEHTKRFEKHLASLRESSPQKELKAFPLEEPPVSREFGEWIERTKALVQEGNKTEGLERLSKVLSNPSLIQQISPALFNTLFQTLFSSGFIKPAITSMYRSYAKIHGPVLASYRFLIDLAGKNLIKLPSFFELVSPNALRNESDFQEYAQEMRAMVRTHPEWAPGLLSHAPVPFIQSLEIFPHEAFDFLIEKWGLALFLTEEGRINRPLVDRLLNESTPREARQIYEILEEKKWEKIDSEILDFLSLISHQSPRPPLGMQSRCVAKMIDLLDKSSSPRTTHEHYVELVKAIGNHSKILSTAQAKRFASLAAPFAHLDPSLAAVLDEIKKRKIGSSKEFPKPVPSMLPPKRGYADYIQEFKENPEKPVELLHRASDQIIADLKEKKIKESQLFKLCLEMKQYCMEASGDFSPVAKILNQAASPKLELLISKCNPADCCPNGIDFSLARIEPLRSQIERPRLKSYFDSLFEGVRGIIEKTPPGEPLNEMRKRAVLQLNHAFRIASDDSLRIEMVYKLKNIAIASSNFEPIATQVIHDYMRQLSEDEIFQRLDKDPFLVHQYMESLLLRNPNHFVSNRMITEVWENEPLSIILCQVCVQHRYWLQIANLYRAINQPQEAIEAYKRALEQECPPETLHSIYLEMREIYVSTNNMGGLLEVSERDLYHYLHTHGPSPVAEFEELVRMIRQDPLAMQRRVLEIVRTAPAPSAYISYLHGLLHYKMINKFKARETQAEFATSAMRHFLAANKSIHDSVSSKPHSKH